jgi:hypothetical protein
LGPYQLGEVERDRIVYGDWGLAHPHKALSTLDLQTRTEFGVVPLHSWSLPKLDGRLHYHCARSGRLQALHQPGPALGLARAWPHDPSVIGST